MRETVDALTEAVVRALMRSRPSGGSFHIEDIQDQVELGLMRGGHHDVARGGHLERAPEGRGAHQVEDSDAGGVVAPQRQGAVARAGHHHATGGPDAQRLAALLDLPDNDLLDLVMGRSSCPDPALQPLLQRLKAA